MKEELIISGRHIPHIDPHLELWHWPISLYLFLGGLSAGILFFAALFTILGKEKEYAGAIKKATIIVPFALGIGLMALMYDLTHIMYVWNLYITIRFESPMSWGAWILMLVTPISVLWVLGYFKEYFPYWSWKTGIVKGLGKFIDWINKYRVAMAWILIPSTVLLGMYTGILLSAFNARPLWNTSILGPLFLVSGMSTGAAVIIWLANSHAERKLFSQIDLGLIIIELFFITHMIVSYYAGPEVQNQAVELLVGGPFTVAFFGFVVILGLAVPAILEILELKGFHFPVAIPVLLVLMGGLVFRFVMIDAGQLTRYLY
jgi:formate-dependent nitrite reductase membrane component NrfD